MDKVRLRTALKKLLGKNEELKGKFVSGGASNSLAGASKIQSDVQQQFITLLSPELLNSMIENNVPLQFFVGLNKETGEIKRYLFDTSVTSEDLKNIHSFQPLKQLQKQAMVTPKKVETGNKYAFSQVTNGCRITTDAQCEVLSSDITVDNISVDDFFNAVQPLPPQDIDVSKDFAGATVYTPFDSFSFQGVSASNSMNDLTEKLQEVAIDRFVSILQQKYTFDFDLNNAPSTITYFNNPFTEQTRKPYAGFVNRLFHGAGIDTPSYHTAKATFGQFSQPVATGAHILDECKEKLVNSFFDGDLVSKHINMFIPCARVNYGSGLVQNVISETIFEENETYTPNSGGTQDDTLTVVGLYDSTGNLIVEISPKIKYIDAFVCSIFYVAGDNEEIENASAGLNLIGFSGCEYEILESDNEDFIFMIKFNNGDVFYIDSFYKLTKK